MKKIPRIHPTLSTQEAALELRVSETTVKRLVRRGTLHTTKPKKSRGHWASFVIVDKAFREEQHRRMHGLKSPRRKHIPNPSSRKSANSAAADNLNLNPALDPSPIQTVTPPDDVLEKCRNAMNICLEAHKDCQCIKDSITRYQNSLDTCLNGKVSAIQESEYSCIRCTAILAAACILQLILAAYYTLCHFNII